MSFLKKLKEDGLYQVGLIAIRGAHAYSLINLTASSEAELEQAVSGNFMKKPFNHILSGM